MERGKTSLMGVGFINSPGALLPLDVIEFAYAHHGDGMKIVLCDICQGTEHK